MSQERLFQYLKTKARFDKPILAKVSWTSFAEKSGSCLYLNALAKIQLPADLQLV